MTWTDLTTDWADTLSQLKARFPRIDESAIAEPPPGPALVADHLARQHDLTPLEAEEELRDWLYVRSLARQATELEFH